MNVTLQLRCSHAPERSAVAWLLVGGEPETWLAELTLWNIALADVRLAALPLGAIVLPGLGQAPQVVGPALPYGCLGQRLYLPVEATFDPPMSDDEVLELLPDDSTLFVWRPAAGLWRLEAAQFFPLARLVAAPPVSGEVWDAAQPGVAVNDRLLSVEPTERPTLEDVLNQGRDDIGSLSPLGDSLPQHPGEPMGGAVGRAVAGAAYGAAQGAAIMLASASMAIAGALSMLGGGSGGATTGGGNAPSTSGRSGPTWIERLAAWARQQQGALANNIDQLRHREIERLLHALDKSPDDGLRFALPLTDLGAGRGLASPSGRLFERDINFNLGRLGGSGSAGDYWDLPSHYRQQLLQKYRELANREISLGRHRRAAYIFAELLGDLTAAAAALAGGGHFREASVIYEQRLKQPLAAARCLEQGGLLAEALALFRELGEWETVGDLYLRLDQVEEARQAYRTAVKKRMATGDALAAASLLDTKLAEPIEAADLLRSCWPDSHQADRCLEELFSLLARRRLHERSHATIAELPQDLPRTELVARLAARLSHVATSYPQVDVQSVAAEATRQLIASRLATAPPTESEKLLASLAALVPSDRLLATDCRRFQSLASEPVLLREPRDRSKLPRLIRSFSLPRADWMSIVSVGDEFFAAGIHRNWLLVVRGNWEGVVQLPTGDPWTLPAELRESPILLAADPRGQGKVCVHVAPGHPPGDLRFPATDSFRHPMEVGPHPGSSASTRGMHYGSAGTLLTLEFDGHAASISTFGDLPHLEAKRSFKIPEDDDDDDDELTDISPVWPFYVRGTTSYFGIGRLITSFRDVASHSLLHSRVRSITGSGSHTRPRIVVACQRGGVVLWGTSADSPRTAFGMELTDPVVGLARGGWLVAATADLIEVWNTQDSKTQWIGQIPGPAKQPLAVTGLNAANRFALFTTDGRVHIYGIPPH
jgi:tetratricopeptide (TPR) repeat protein